MSPSLSPVLGYTALGCALSPNPVGILGCGAAGCVCWENDNPANAAIKIMMNLERMSPPRKQ
jgi:hypothetical protein